MKPNRCMILALLSTVTLACSGPTSPPPGDEWVAELESWRETRASDLAAPDGWLALAGLHWLEPGVNTVGGDPSADVQLPAAAAPDEVARLILEEDGSVRLEPLMDELRLNEGPATATTLASDADGRPDILTHGRLRWYLIDRDGRVGVRVKDTEAPTRVGFEGLEWYPPDPAFRVTATLEAHDEPRVLEVPTVLGTVSESPSPGILRFEVDGRELSLHPVGYAADQPLFLIFRDRTSGDTTYGAGRFLTTGAPAADGTVVLDFNRAYNPPCAYTPYATCPLPPPENVLPVAVTAGERYAGEAH